MDDIPYLIAIAVAGLVALVIAGFIAADMLGHWLEQDQRKELP